MGWGDRAAEALLIEKGAGVVLLFWSNGLAVPESFFVSLRYD